MVANLVPILPCVLKLLFHFLGKCIINQKPQSYSGHPLARQDGQPVSFICTRSIMKSGRVVDSIILDWNGIHPVKARTNVRDIAYLYQLRLPGRWENLP